MLSSVVACETVDWECKSERDEDQDLQVAFDSLNSIQCQLLVGIQLDLKEASNELWNTQQFLKDLVKAVPADLKPKDKSKQQL
jgi:hypothetical protein